MASIITAIALILTIHCTPLVASAQETAPAWAELFAERLTTNQEYLTELAEYYDLNNDKEKAEYERSKRTQQQLLTFIATLAKDDDQRLQAQFLKFEYLWELENAFFDMEYAEDMAERLALAGKIAIYTNHLRTVDAWLEAQSQDSPTAETTNADE